MSELKWLPGPWRFGEISPYEDDPREISVMADNPRDGSPYCVAVAIPCGAGKLNRDLAPKTTEANAHLIAAAPELYASLENFVNELVEYDIWGDSDPETDPNIIAARALLAKARGEMQ